jgi:putative hydrolase of the HAD superfamily
VIRAVAFDIDHTLLIDNKLERVAFLHMLEIVIRDGGHALGSLSDESARIDALLAEQRSGAFPIDEAVQRFVAERGIAPSDSYVERYRALVLDMVDRFVTPAPDAVSTLRALEARGYTLAILSNGWSPLQQRKANRVGFRGPVVASADLGVQKPDPRAFVALTARLGVDPRAVWYVGDDPRIDVAGAAGAGLHSVWIDAEGVKYPPELPAPLTVIGSLSELLALLPGPVQV